MTIFPWAKISKDKASVKLHVGLHHGNRLPEFAINDGIENDMVEERQCHFPQGSVVAFDKGYVNYPWFGSLTPQGVFVTR